MENDREKNVTIIGAGFTGLSAAYYLSKKGYNVEIFESAPFIGGQASTILLSGFEIERGYHHLFTGDSDIIELIEDKIQKEKDKLIHHWEAEGIRVEKARWGRHTI